MRWTTLCSLVVSLSVGGCAHGRAIEVAPAGCAPLADGEGVASWGWMEHALRAPERRSALTGTVSGEDGDPVAGSVVELHSGCNFDSALSALRREGVADAGRLAACRVGDDGRFAFSGPFAPGEYELRAGNEDRKIGWDIVRLCVELVSDSDQVSARDGDDLAIVLPLAQ